MLKRKYVIVICLSGFFALACFTSLFSCTKYFTDTYILSKWLMALLSLGAMSGGCSLSVLQTSWFEIKRSLFFFIIMVSCLCQGLYGLFQHCIEQSFLVFNWGISGSFDNPAGFAACLCAGLPFSLYFVVQYRKGLIRILGLISLCIMVLAILASCSRSGLLSMGGILLLYSFRQKKIVINKKMKYIYFPVVSFLFFIGLYFVKKDSANGRILIWECAWNMVKDKPFAGHGMYGVEAHYMDYQAEYFMNHPNSPYSMLAGNVKSVFNEYLSVWVRYGSVVFFVLLIFVCFLFHCYRKHQTVEGDIAVFSLLGIAIFSFFSYPLTYPFVWIVLLIDAIVIIYDAYPFIPYNQVYRIVLSILFVTITLITFSFVGKRVYAELKWNEILQNSSITGIKSSLPVYSALFPLLKDNPYFLYNYAVDLSIIGDDCASLKMSLLCRQYWADYDLELLIGDNYRKLGQKACAETYYKKAALMCPSRFTPLYKLYYLYKANGDINEAYKTGMVIINKPMKFKTLEIVLMKREIEQDLKKTDESFLGTYVSK